MHSNTKGSNQIDQILIGNNDDDQHASKQYFDFNDISDLILNAHDEDDEDVINTTIDKNVNLVYEKDPYTLRWFLKGFFHSNRYHVFIIILV